MATFQKIIDKTYTHLGESSTSLNYNDADRVKDKINDISQLLCRGKYINPITKEVYIAGDLSFLQKTLQISVAPPVILSEDIDTDSTEITTSTANLDSSGRVYLNGDLITYTGKTATQLTGVTGITVAHVAQSIIYPLNTGPVDIDKPVTVFVVDGENWRELHYQDWREEDERSQYYTYATDSEGTRFLLIKGFSTVKKFNIVYYSAFTRMSDLVDICEVPDPYAKDMIGALSAGEILLEDEETQLASEKLSLGCTKLDLMYRYYAKPTYNKRRSIKSLPRRSHALNRNRYR